MQKHLFQKIFAVGSGENQTLLLLCCVPYVLMAFGTAVWMRQRKD